MLNSIGLQNPGVDAVIEKYAKTWAGWKVPVIVNVAGESVSDYVEVTRRLEGVPGIAGIELNISCPNVGRGGLQFAIDAGAAGEVTAAVRRATDLPLLVKLSPNVADIRPIARGHRRRRRRRADRHQHPVRHRRGAGPGEPLLGNIYGGLSGPAVKPVALRVVYEAAQAVKIPVVAIGGVTELADVLDFLAVGAVAVQVGTAIFADPTLPVRLVDELAAECRRVGVTTHLDLVGTALPKRAGAPSAKGVEYRPVRRAFDVSSTHGMVCACSANARRCCCPPSRSQSSSGSPRGMAGRLARSSATRSTVTSIPDCDSRRAAGEAIKAMNLPSRGLGGHESPDPAQPAR